MTRRKLLIIVMLLVLSPSFLIITLSKLGSVPLETYIYKTINDQTLTDSDKAQIILENWDEFDIISFKESYPYEMETLYTYIYNYAYYSPKDIQAFMEKCDILGQIDSEHYALLIEHLFVEDTQDYFQAYINASHDIQVQNIEWLRYGIRDYYYDLNSAKEHINYYKLNSYEQQEWTTLISSLETNDR